MMPSFLRRNRRLFLPGLVLVLLVLAWDGIVRVIGIPPILLPGPGEVYEIAVSESSLLLPAAWTTLSEILLAACLAIVGGVLTGGLIFFSPLVRRGLFPYILMTQVVPKVALAPVLIIWFGVGLTSRLVLAFLIAYFPMVINTVTGLMTASNSMLLYARSLAASDWQVFAKVRLPHALPAIVGGMKITVSVSVIGIIVGEFVASEGGLGRLILESAAVLNTPLTIAAIVLVGVIGLALLGIVELLERRMVFWRVSDDGSL
ncbi:MAG: ABC transporter permease [Nitrospinota bacterium]